jgi:hypothetical protein
MGIQYTCLHKESLKFKEERKMTKTTILSQLSEKEIKGYTDTIVDNIILLNKDEHTINCYFKSNDVQFNRNVLIEDDGEVYEAVIYNNIGGLVIYNVEAKKLKNVASLENALVLGIFIGKLDLEISLNQFIK